MPPILTELIASSSLLISVTSVVIAVSRDIFDGEYIDGKEKSGVTFIWRFATDNATKLRKAIKMVPFMVLVMYGLVVVIHVFPNGPSGTEQRYFDNKDKLTILHILEVSVLVYTLEIVRRSMTVRSRKAEGVIL